MKIVCHLIAFGLFLWAFSRNVLDVQEVFLVVGAFGWITMGEGK